MAWICWACQFGGVQHLRALHCCNMLQLSHCLEDQSRLICPSNIPWMSLQEYKYYSKLGLPYISIFTVFKASWWEADNVAASRWALFRFVRAVQFIVHGSKMLELSCCLLNLDTFWEHHKYTCIHITQILFNIIYLYIIYIHILWRKIRKSAETFVGSINKLCI